jgi:hypothetical protein
MVVAQIADADAARRAVIHSLIRKNVDNFGRSIDSRRVLPNY